MSLTRKKKDHTVLSFTAVSRAGGYRFFNLAQIDLGAGPALCNIRHWPYAGPLELAGPHKDKWISGAWKKFLEDLGKH